MARGMLFRFACNITVLSAIGLLYACGGGGGGAAGGAVGNGSATYKLSGTVTGDVQQGVTISLSGAAVATTSTNTSGAYSFSGLANGSYTVTASRPSYTFTPAIQTVDINSANGTANFVSQQTYSISGMAADGSAIATPGVTMTLTTLSSNAIATTNGSGNYSFGGLLSGATYTITPAKAPVYDLVSTPHTVTTYTFGPANIAGSMSAADVIGANFVTYASTTTAYSVSGKIVTGTNTSLGPQPFILDNIAVRLSDPAYVNTIIATTDSGGNYSFDAVPNGSYILWVAHFSAWGSCANPTFLTLYDFSPSSQPIVVSGGSLTIGDITENVSREGCAHIKPDGAAQ